MAARKKARKGSKKSVRKAGNIFKKASQDKGYKAAKAAAKKAAKKAAMKYRDAVRKLKKSKR